MRPPTPQPGAHLRAYRLTLPTHPPCEVATLAAIDAADFAAHWVGEPLRDLSLALVGFEPGEVRTLHDDDGRGLTVERVR